LFAGLWFYVARNSSLLPLGELLAITEPVRLVFVSIGKIGLLVSLLLYGVIRLAKYVKKKVLAQRKQERLAQKQASVGKIVTPDGGSRYNCGQKEDTMEIDRSQLRFSPSAGGVEQFPLMGEAQKPKGGNPVAAADSPNPVHAARHQKTAGCGKHRGGFFRKRPRYRQMTSPEPPLDLSELFHPLPARQKQTLEQAIYPPSPDGGLHKEGDISREEPLGRS
ncbi:MAG: hypothetical protein RR051_02290, partial [Clostridiales bacterium]